MIISVSGDLHGRIDYLYATNSRWQQINKKFVDLMFQVGDAGFYRSPSDKATLKHLKKDAKETYFADILNENINWEEFKAKFKTSNPYSEIKATMIFIDGNHDDHKLIDEYTAKSNQGPIIPINEDIQYFRRGKFAEIQCNYDSLYVAGLGGIDKKNRPNVFENNEKVAFSDDDLISLFNQQEPVDIFLTHMYPQIVRNNGSSDVSYMVDVLQPQYHFFGHDHKPYRFKIKNGYSIGLGKLGPDVMTNIYEGNVVFLEKKGFEVKELT
jgi:predicted phosphodiesterase